MIDGKIAVLAGLVVALIVFSATPSSAQDLELEPLFLVVAESDVVLDASADSLQLYRIPVSFTVRSLDEHPWGLRLLLPLSIGAHDLRASTGVGDFAERIETMTIVPGAELQLRAGEAWLLKPFAELGLTSASSGGQTGALLSVGVRARGEYALQRSFVTVGAAARYSSSRSSRVRIGDYTVLEAGADIQWPLRRDLGRREARLGGYAIVRFFPDLDRPPSLENELERVYEAGLSFSTEPRVKLWKLELPWIGIGYRFGDLFSGVRISLSFPF